MPLLYPKPLKPDSKIGLICPAGGFDDYKPIKHVSKYLLQQGYKVNHGKSLICSRSEYTYLSGSDSKRLSDLHRSFSDKNIDAIFCLRGGYGSLRLLDCIDFNLIKRSKKIILGFSDITVLLLSIYAKTSLITFHGPLLGIKYLNNNLKAKDKNTEQNFWKILQDPKFSFLYSYKSKGKIIYRGKTRGKLLGGNLTDICSMLGSTYLPDFKDSILFLEDCYEEPYKIDRLLTQLDNAGIFKKVNGLLFSNFYKCGFKNHKEVINLLEDKVKKYKIPTIYNFPISHGLQNYTVPIGLPCILDTDTITLKSL